MLPELLDRARPSSPALLVDDEVFTFGRLAEESRRAAQGLAELGVGRGDRVALWLPNLPAWLVLFFACARLGAIAVAVNTRFRAAEVEDIVGRSGAKVLAFAPGFRRIDFAGILAELELARLESVVLVGPGEGPKGKRAVGYDALLARPPLPESRGEADSGVLVFTTSGTTKAPKFVLHTQASLARHASDVATGFGWRAPGTVLYQGLPYCGTFGLAQALGALAAGAPSVQTPTFDASEAAAILVRHRVTDFNGTDEMMARLIEAGADFRTVRGAGYAAFDPALADLAARAERAGLRLFGLYGSSELQALYARWPLDMELPDRARPGGRPTSPEARFRVRDPATGRLLGPGESGELEVAGPSRMKEYLGDAEATRAALTEDGFVRMGDLAQLTEDGGFIFETRLGDVLRLGGFLVAPAEIEAWLQRHPAVDGCQVVGAGARAVAFVTLRAPADEAALIEHCASGLARFKIPARIVALDAFPTTPSANGVKVQKAKLRQMAMELIS
ncbi:MAG: AMP-binding protein [Rhodospirillales bacterium]|nr:AMP-binding protein [Rhodospirillales bacterium]